jgi:hypothetical protein
VWWPCVRFVPPGWQPGSTAGKDAHRYTSVANAVLKSIRASTLRSAATEDGQKHKAWLIREVVKGKVEARVV